MYSPSLHSTRIGGAWVRMTACMTAGRVSASQIQLLPQSGLAPLFTLMPEMLARSRHEHPARQLSRLGRFLNKVVTQQTSGISSPPGADWSQHVQFHGRAHETSMAYYPPIGRIALVSGWGFGHTHGKVALRRFSSVSMKGQSGPSGTERVCSCDPFLARLIPSYESLEESLNPGMGFGVADEMTIRGPTLDREASCIALPHAALALQLSVPTTRISAIVTGIPSERERGFMGWLHRHRHQIRLQPGGPWRLDRRFA
ncbi:hypothetical protein BU23DRAFT_571610 [Bimuria novae-zelandiae CBS 107.79]|uniref:Uncharacterized protein n=1 Tax=Bimuria novae-zelandiae CBS 107.79 TaxID=1447943 RepID=A0A6A5V004_9PLEO|nr:hypothetical protein BU23DRAFT_571610 [Bimuria novae-zelandiae CBS 107.79]